MVSTEKSGSRRARFLCESCGAEVPMDAKKCPNCGSSFESVRCPNCGFTGEEAAFRGGCPSCGCNAGNSPHRGPKSKKEDSALPLWVYVLSAVILAGVLAALFFRFFR